MLAKLAGEQIFLLLNRSSDLRDHEIQVVPSVDSALQAWNSTTRISPIFPIDNATFPSTEHGARWYLFFIGPVDIGTVDLEGVLAFASYGVHNLVIVTDVNEDPAVDALLHKFREVPWEAWSVCGTRIVDVAFSPLLTRPKTPKNLGVAAKMSLPPQLKSASEEYRTLNAVTRAKCEKYLPQFVQDIDDFDDVFQRALKSTSQHAVEKLAWLANVNAALSRFSSQTFAGTSPIRETECHFWTHSLLGIGTASQALTNIRRHHDSALRASRLAEKVAALAGVPAGPKNLTQLGFTDAAWRKHLLTGVTLAPADEPQKFLKLIAYFSGRDGYKSTPFTLSAPLELITGCNTFAWTPLTLTHELSHTITSQLLGVLLKGAFGPNNQSQLEHLVRLVSPKEDYAPRNALEQAQKTLITAYVFLDREHLTGEQRQPSVVDLESVLPLIQRYRDEMSELVTHVLDFQYFYGRDAELYMTSLWESWDVIPNIQSRIDEYLIRTLVAVLSANQHVANPMVSTYEIVLEQLKVLAGRAAGGQYMAAAFKRLQAARTLFLDRMQRRVHIVKLVLAFFYDPATAANIARETPAKGGEYANFHADEFDSRQIRNPLKFLAKFSSDQPPNTRKSLWILHKLAFAEAQ